MLAAHELLDGGQPLALAAADARGARVLCARQTQKLHHGVNPPGPVQHLSRELDKRLVREVVEMVVRSKGFDGEWRRDVGVRARPVSAVPAAGQVVLCALVGAIVQRISDLETAVCSTHTVSISATNLCMCAIAVGPKPPIAVRDAA